MDQLDDGHVRVRGPASAGLLAALVIAAAALGGCQFPRDAADTLSGVRDGTLRVGVTEHDPWVRLDGRDPAGVEIGLIREFAAKLGAEVDYTADSEEELVEALERRDLDVVVGGITDRTPWKKTVAITKPYVTTHPIVSGERKAEEHVMLTSPGENAFLVELEHFLLEREARARRLLAQEGGE